MTSHGWHCRHANKAFLDLNQIDTGETELTTRQKRNAPGTGVICHNTNTNSLFMRIHFGYSVYSIVSAYCLTHHGIPQGSLRGPFVLSLNTWLHCVLCLCMTTRSNICITALCYYLCIAECLEVINITTRSCLLLILVFATPLEVFHLRAAHFRESSPVYKFKALVYLNQERQ